MVKLAVDQFHGTDIQIGRISAECCRRDLADHALDSGFKILLRYMADVDIDRALLECRVYLFKQAMNAMAELKCMTSLRQRLRRWLLKHSFHAPGRMTAGKFVNSSRYLLGAALRVVDIPQIRQALFAERSEKSEILIEAIENGLDFVRRRTFADFQGNVVGEVLEAADIGNDEWDAEGKTVKRCARPGRLPLATLPLPSLLRRRRAAAPTTAPWRSSSRRSWLRQRARS